MNLKYFDHILKHLPVIFACVLLGALARVAFLYKGVDDYTANIIFWCVSALFIVVYASIVLFLDGIIVLFRKIFPKKNNSKNSTVDFIQTKNHENITIGQKKIIDYNTANQLIEDSKENIADQTMERVNLESIRKTQLQQKQQIESEKLQVAVDYTRNQFALYLKDQDLDMLCDAVNLYSVKEDILNNNSVYTKDLTNLDLYHFGWNIWNHFRPIKQEEVSKLLKNVFVSLDDIDLESIKSHLKDEPKRGIIKIQENLTDYQKT